MTAKDILVQIENVFGRLPEKFVFQLINDALDDIASKKKNYQVSQIADLEGYKRLTCINFNSNFIVILISKC